ncbi:MAG: hypothetical protein JSR09_09800 [Bacteroidetes bacterium]|nr:hypothetical protein [Bacteroidota bacterium]
MKNFLLFTSMLTMLLSCATTNQYHLIKGNLRSRIDSLYQADQATVKIKPADSAAAAYQRTIRNNFPTVSYIFKKFGFPGYDLVGRETSNKYFLLVQHSDFNLNFQQEVLQAMKKQVERKNASGQDFAYLTDRIEINNGRPQIYGTQVLMSGNTKTKPCIDTLNLDNRRKTVGLSPIKVYLEQCNETFYQMNPQERPNKSN